MVIRKGGLNIPVFSLRTKQSLGVGEFLDLLPMIDWCEEAGLKVLQLLPIHDTIGGHPYSILSFYSLHPLYLNLQAIASKEEEERIAKLARELNAPRLDYEKVLQTKMELLREIYEGRGDKDLSTKAFDAFFQKHAEHLKPYAAFCALSHHYKTRDFRKWQEHSNYSEELVEQVCASFAVDFYYFIQYHLDKQLKEVVRYAKDKGILLKGDFSMGVDRCSVEAWRFHHYFRWDKSMGAPPDFYNAFGQNWGFPSYDWEAIAADNYTFLTSRLKWLEPYFDLMRIDHVLGYFRLWEIPTGEVRGLMGNFFPAQGYTEQELVEKGLSLPEVTQTQRVVQETVKEKGKRERLYAEIEDRLFFNREGSYHPRIDVKSTKTFKALPKEKQETVLQLFNAYYHKRQEGLWKERGERHLRLIQKATKMELCAEDIGVIPRNVSKRCSKSSRS
jgi:4-alpha-glucanotransferase